MFKKKVPLFYVLVSAVIGCGIAWFIFSVVSRSGTGRPDSDELNADTNGEANYRIQRNARSYKFISPILSVEPINESVKYAALKNSIQEFIDKEKQGGRLLSASVYVKDFRKGEWMAINPKEIYNPGSLLKVGVLITYMSMAEGHPDYLKKEITYHGEPGFVFPVEHYRSDTVLEGHKYTLDELLGFMIRNSDNRATVYLENYMDTTIFKQEFADLGITEPRFNDPTYSLNVQEYSMMFKALYNAGYLRRNASEKALELLSESNFKFGLLKELPANVVVAHKFGEAGNQTMHELHESGIIYLSSNPYMITIMTKGTDWDRLSDDVGHISRIVYDQMSASGDESASYKSSGAK